ncbi:MAG TPA: outer membrane lipoprotein carrier protein LolA [Candidatus Hydrogenedentes bacterium]|nr:outer membrane lipoprotein carrier protein LolA [Candidatus Hydrogenedentota bacterium]
MNAMPAYTRSMIVHAALLACAWAGTSWADTGAATSSTGQDVSSPSALERIRQEFSAIETVEADFVQTRRTSLLQNDIQAQGKLYFRAPDSLRLEIAAPIHSVTIVRGRMIARFERENGLWKKQVTGRMDSAKTIARQMTAWLQGRFFGEDDDRYEITTMDQKTPLISLIPRNKHLRERLAGIDLQFATPPLRLECLTLRETHGDETVLRFSNEVRNAPLSDDLFDLSGKSFPRTDADQE